jgi:hypothetical protein
MIQQLNGRMQKTADWVKLIGRAIMSLRIADHPSVPMFIHWYQLWQHPGLGYIYENAQGQIFYADSTHRTNYLAANGYVDLNGQPCFGIGFEHPVPGRRCAK